MKKQIRFKVRYGFDKTASLSIEAGPDLEKAIYAWIQQIPIAVGGKMIQGKHIISIEPDYHYYTGWYESYTPTTGDDWAQIERDCPDTEGYVNAYRQRVMQLIADKQTHLIGNGTPIQIENIKSFRTGSSFAQQVLQEGNANNN